jgi:hypothetical protein
MNNNDAEFEELARLRREIQNRILEEIINLANVFTQVVMTSIGCSVMYVAVNYGDLEICPDFTRNDWVFTEIGRNFCWIVLYGFMGHLWRTHSLDETLFPQLSQTGMRFAIICRTMVVCFCLYRENMLFHVMFLGFGPVLFGMGLIMTDRAIFAQDMQVRTRTIVEIVLCIIIILLSLSVFLKVVYAIFMWILGLIYRLFRRWLIYSGG